MLIPLGRTLKMWGKISVAPEPRLGWARYTLELLAKKLGLAHANFSKGSFFCKLRENELSFEILYIL